MTRQISAVEADQRPGEEVLLAVPMKLKEAIVPAQRRNRILLCDILTIRLQTP